jgi:hypothetical protein
MKKALAVVLAVALLGSGMAVSTPSGYSVSVSGETTDIPTTSISFGGNSHTVREVAVRGEGESVTVDAEGQTNETYSVNLYNSDGDVVQSSRKGGGSSTTSFDLDCCSSGTYAPSLYDNEVQDVAGVVVAGYDVDLEIPREAHQNATFEATVDLDTTRGGSIERVEVFFVGNEVIRSTATRQSGSTYTASVSLDDASTGSYDAYGVVFSPETFDNGENEIIGLSSGQSFSVREDDGSGETGDSTTRSTDDDSGTGSDNDSLVGTTNDNTTTDSPDGETPDDSTTDDGRSDPGDGETADPTDGESSGGDSPGTDDSGPADADDSGPAGTDADGTGLGLLVAAVALVAIVVAGRRRR